MSWDNGNGAARYLVFTLDEEDFAVEAARVREVLEYTPITRVPRMPAFIPGVINLRGDVAPVVDLRLKLGMSAAAHTVDTSIVIVDVLYGGESARIGALVDRVKEVIHRESGQITPKPRLGTRLKSEFVKGMCSMDEDRLMIILDIDRILSEEELTETG